MSWDFKREERKYTVIPEGDYRVRINSAEKAVSKSGKDMLIIKMDVSGRSELLFDYIVFLPDRPEITNRRLTQLFDSFAGIAEGDFNTASWTGKVGAVHVKHEDYNGNPSAKVGYYISAAKADRLPAWQEPENYTRIKGDIETPAPGQMAAAPVGDEDFPFK